MTTSPESPLKKPLESFARPPLLDLTSGRLAPGVWSYGSIPDDFSGQANDLGWVSMSIDASTSNSKATFLEEICRAGSFPDHFGQNWDAVADCLTDLSWLPARGYLVLVRQTTADTPEALRLLHILHDVLVDMWKFWAEAGTPVQILWENPATGDPATEGPDLAQMGKVPDHQQVVGTVHEWPTPTT